MKFKLTQYQAVSDVESLRTSTYNAGLRAWRHSNFGNTFAPDGADAMPHLEFVVAGPPVSHQTSDKANLKAWQTKIRDEAAKSWKGPALTGKLKFVVFNFHEGDKPPLDDDNMIKPIRDALNRFVYEDDRQIRHSETYHVPFDDPIKIRGASAVLLAACSRGAEFVYVRVEDAPAFVQLPG